MSFCKPKVWSKVCIRIHLGIHTDQFVHYHPYTPMVVFEICSPNPFRLGLTPIKSPLELVHMIYQYHNRRHITLFRKIAHCVCGKSQRRTVKWKLYYIPDLPSLSFSIRIRTSSSILKSIMGEVLKASSRSSSVKKCSHTMASSVCGAHSKL